MPQEFVLVRIGEQIDMTVPEMLKEIVEDVQISENERDQLFTATLSGIVMM